MSKPKIYEYEGRTFEVKVYNEAYGLIAILSMKLFVLSVNSLVELGLFIMTMLFSISIPLLRQQ